MTKLAYECVSAGGISPLSLHRKWYREWS